MYLLHFSAEVSVEVTRGHERASSAILGNFRESSACFGAILARRKGKRKEQIHYFSASL